MHVVIFKRTNIWGLLQHWNNRSQQAENQFKLVRPRMPKKSLGTFQKRNGLSVPILRFFQYNSLTAMKILHVALKYVIHSVGNSAVSSFATFFANIFLLIEKAIS